jgi:hypothetical protein
MSSKRQAALADLKARLAWITLANGYSTDAGNAIYYGVRLALQDGDPDAFLAVLVADAETEQLGPRLRQRLPIEIHCYAKVTSIDDPMEDVEELIADIKRAVEIERDGANVDRFLGTAVDGVPYGTLPKGVERGSVRVFPRDEGMTTVGCSVSYTLVFDELWGQP